MKTNTRIDFNNLEIAFKDKSTKELREAYVLFKTMNNPFLVKMGKALVNIAFSLRIPINWIIKNTIYKYFVGGSDIEDSKKTIEKLSEKNVKTILDFAAEGELKEEFFDNTCSEVIKTTELAKDNKDIPFSAFKITGLGRFDLMVKVSEKAELSQEEIEEFEKIKLRVDSIFQKAKENSVPVLVDAEHSWIQPMLDELVMNNMMKYNTEKAIVQNTYQMYKHESLSKIKEHHKLSLDKGFKYGLKIVRGAYMEIERERAKNLNYPSPIQEDKTATDRDFDDAIRYFVENVETIDFMIATHNEESSILLAELMDKHNLPKDHPSIYFSQLYGMSDHITNNIANLGYNVAKYVPYGQVKTMMPYLFRRAEENTSVKGQSSRELGLIRTEIKRREED